MKKRIYISLFVTALLLSISDVVCAQQFTVKSFRILPNDISSYINPVRDLNGEACALIKVVGSNDFVFSSPLGIVHRKNETGEIWIYLPKGSVQLTIKHPQWGVLRDFSFGCALESRMTYELILTPPAVHLSIADIPLENIYSHLDTALHIKPSVSKFKRHFPLQPLRMYTAILGGYHTGGASLGVMIGLLRRHGIYLHVQSDFRSLPSTAGDCDKDGVVAGGNAQPYYSGTKKDGRYLCFIGGMHRITLGFTLYEGLGYGKRTLAWQKSDGTLLRNTGYSANGVAIELGGIVSIGRLFASTGVMTIAGKYWEPAIGLGYKF